MQNYRCKKFFFCAEVVCSQSMPEMISSVCHADELRIGSSIEDYRNAEARGSTDGVLEFEKLLKSF